MEQTKYDNLKSVLKICGINIMATLEEHLNTLSLKQIKNLVREHNLHSKIMLGQPKDALIAALLRHFEELVDDDMVSSIYKIKVPKETDIVPKKGRARVVNPNLQKPAITQQEINPGEAVIRQIMEPKRKTGTLVNNDTKANLQEAVRIPEEKVLTEYEKKDDIYKVIDKYLDDYKKAYLEPHQQIDIISELQKKVAAYEKANDTIVKRRIFKEDGSIPLDYLWFVKKTSPVSKKSEPVKIPEERVAVVEPEPEPEDEPGDEPVEEESVTDNYPPEPYTLPNGDKGIITRKRYPPEAKPFPKEKQKTATYKNKEWKIGDFVYVVRGNDKNKRGKIVKFEGDKAIINKVDYHYARWNMIDGQYEYGRKIYYYIDPSIPGTRFSAGLGNIVKMPYEYDADSGR